MEAGGACVTKLEGDGEALVLEDFLTSIFWMERDCVLRILERKCGFLAGKLPVGSRFDVTIEGDTSRDIRSGKSFRADIECVLRTDSLTSSSEENFAFFPFSPPFPSISVNFVKVDRFLCFFDLFAQSPSACAPSDAFGSAV